MGGTGNATERRPVARRQPGTRRRSGLRAILGITLLLSVGCGPKPVFRTPPSGRAPSRPAPTPEAPAPAPAPAPTVVEEVASGWVGTPYRYGGTDERGIDCSALAQYILGDLGARLPRTTKAQRRTGKRVALGEIRPGDLLFFRLESSRVNHVGVALGRDRFVHSSSSRGVVVDRLMDDYFARRVVEARRVLSDP
jgi:cell wall-associated NlpC family hydrolase